MTQFKTGDRVKVVRESVSLSAFNCILGKTIGETGKIEEARDGARTCLVRLHDGIALYFPADMLELEPKS